MTEMHPVINQLWELLVSYGSKVVGALVVLIIGLYVIKLVTKAIVKLMERRNTDPSLRGFLRSLISIGLKVLLIITCADMLGIEMTSFIALLGAAGLAVGMALSGTLQNFAGGVMILLFRPFKAGDYIAAQGFEGVVKEIQIFNTLLTTVDNKVVIIPNGGLSTGSMTNFSTMPNRRVDINVGIAYGSDVNQAKTILMNLAKADSRVLTEAGYETVVFLTALSESSVDLSLRMWVESANYWAVLFDMNEKVYAAFKENGVEIPFPQMQVHISK